ncbi:MAG TPA: hypothetical protein VKE69_15120 [Planctomycetota bacterium]|nr:hypothetical protein [Planctomycetota bacterium]
MPDPEYRISVHPDDRMIEVVLRSPNGDKWEYGIPYNESGRFAFEDIKVVELDFGSEFAERMLADIRSAVDRALAAP